MAAIRTALFPTPEALKDFATDRGDILLLLSLGFPPESFLEAAREAAGTVLLADCYGVIGTEPETGRNREFMEEGRGTEYGGVGGRGGRAVVAVAFSGAEAGEGPPPPAPAHLVIAAHGRPYPPASPLFGGVAKRTWRWDREEEKFVETDGLRISLPEALRVGIKLFTGQPEPALRALKEAIPSSLRLDAVALFPCYMRGINLYGRDDVEPEAVAKVAPGVPIFGMFCHGELGPRGAWGYGLGPETPCGQHSMVTVAAFLGR